MNKNFMRIISTLLVALMLTLVVSPASVFAEGTKGNTLYLKGYKLDANQELKLPKGLIKKAYVDGEKGPYLVMFNGPIIESMKAQVENIGAELIEYIPNFAFLAKMTPEISEKVEALSFINDTMIYHPGFKINPALKDEFGNIKDNGEISVRIVTFDNDTTSLDSEIVKSNGKKLGHSKNMTIAKLNSNSLANIAKLNSVKYIEPNPEYTLFNDIAKGYMDVDDMWNLGYDGTNQVVAVCDTGLDTGVNDSSMHLDFQGRINSLIALGRETADDPHGHGTHVAGSVLGDGARSNGQYAGMAPNANLVFQSVLDSRGGLGGLPSDLNTLFAQAWTAGARIHTNSWGAAVYGDYTTDSQAVDEYVWNNDMIILFAAGNEGDGSTGTDYDSIGAPATAKNCITVGASENYRPSEGTSADDPNEIAWFSSRGWCEDGRIKPDIVAPGTWILSTKSTLAPDNSFWDIYDNYYAYMGGTSMSTPLTAGAVAVARQYMQENWNHTPSPAMMKAAIINGGTDLGFGYPSADQGWGRISLTDSLTAKEYKYEDETNSLSTGQSQNFSYAVESNNHPLKISLVWTDYPASTTASIALVNDLDLKITSPSGTVYYGNDFSSPYNSSYDRINNVENIFIDNPEVGTYTVEVSAYNIPQGPQPFALFSSGDFGTASSDTIPPTCSITAPTNGATVSNTITYSADATDNEAMSRVEFYVDSNLIGTDSTSPYSIDWDTTTVVNGTRTLVAKAIDIAGNTTDSTSISVDVQNQITIVYQTDTFNDKVKLNEYDDFYIDVTGSGTITLDLSWSDGETLSMSLYSPSGTLLDTGSSSITYNATNTGTYKISVTKTASKVRPSYYTLTATYPVIQ